MMWSRVYAGGEIPYPTNCHTISLIGRRLFVIGGFSAPAHAGMTHVYSVGAWPCSFVCRCVVPDAGWWCSGCRCRAPRAAHTRPLCGAWRRVVGCQTRGARRGTADAVCRARKCPPLPPPSVLLVCPDSSIWRHPQERGAIPPHRYAHTAVVRDRFVYIFGGYSTEFGWLNDLYMLDTGGLRCCGVGCAAVVWASLLWCAHHRPFFCFFFLGGGGGGPRTRAVLKAGGRVTGSATRGQCVSLHPHCGLTTRSPSRLRELGVAAVPDAAGPLGAPPPCDRTRRDGVEPARHARQP
jgi:hypothetical protein